MTRFNLTMLAGIASAGIAASLLVQHHAAAAMRQNDNSLRQQQDEIARTTEENQRLANQVAQVAESNNRGTDYSAELAQLQAKAAALRLQENQMSNRLWNSRISAGTRLLASENYNLTNYSDWIAPSVEGGPRAESSKLNDARAFTTALLRYARMHQGIFPLSLDQVASYLPRPLDPNSKPWDDAPVSGTNDFEIVFQGTTNDLANIPLRRVALIRERQPWLTPDGKWAKTYGYADGHSEETVTSDDNFQSWDALHIVPPPTAQ